MVVAKNVHIKDMNLLSKITITITYSLNANSHTYVFSLISCVFVDLAAQNAFAGINEVVLNSADLNKSYYFLICTFN